MKILIWGACCFFGSLVQTTLKFVFHIQLGAIPTFLLWGCLFSLARFLCSVWDKHKQTNVKKLFPTNFELDLVYYIYDQAKLLVPQITETLDALKTQVDETGEDILETGIKSGALNGFFSSVNCAVLNLLQTESPEVFGRIDNILQQRGYASPACCSESDHPLLAMPCDDFFDICCYSILEHDATIDQKQFIRKLLLNLFQSSSVVGIRHALLKE